ncbi:MAG: type II and III secretion system protein family protein [Rubrivivax sp.]
MKPSILLLSTCACLVTVLSAAQAQTADAPPCRTVQAAEPVRVSVGKSIVWKPAAPVRRVVLGNPDRAPAALSGPAQAPGDRDGEGAGLGRAAPAGAATRRPGVADVDLLLLSPGEIVLQARTLGSTNFVLVDGQGRCTALDVIVDLDTGALQTLVERLLPAEREIRITPAFDAVVLTGSVSDSEALARVTELSQAFLRSHDGGGSGGRRLVNLLEVGAAQQVMLEVKVAEVSKALIDKLGVAVGGTRTRGQWTYSLLADFLSGGAGAASLGRLSGSLGVTVDGQKDDALVKVLAEPTVMALSGQTGSFLAGGKIFIPVAQDAASNGGRSVTLEEKEFGVSLRFTPTVLGSGRIHLKVRPEVSEINREGIGIVASGIAGTSVLPSFTSRKAETTVQLLDGQSFAIGGLIRHNDSASVKAFPFLGELPVIGALFRSTEFQSDRSELVFVITPRLVKPLPANYRLPTDGYVPPTRSQLMGHGQVEGAVRSDDAVRWLNQAQRQDPQATERRGQTVAPVDARALPARPGAHTPGMAAPSGPPGDRPPLLIQP